VQKTAQTTNFEEFYSKLRELRYVLTSSVEYIVYVITATLAMQQIVFVARFAAYGPIIVEIIALIFLSRVLVEVGNVLIDKLLLRRTERMTDIQWQQRLTFSPLTKSLLKYTIYFGVFLFALHLLNVNIIPVLTALGGIGLIIGLGAQPVILDMISGVFIVFENHYLVGDYIETGEAEGIVEAIDIRTTRIRNPDGQVHILRNGLLGDIVNFSKDYIFATVKVTVAYDADLSQVFRIIETEGARLKELNEDAIETTLIEGVSEFGDYTLIIDTLTKAKPGRHREVGYHLRQLLKEAFEREGVNIPIPLRKVTLQSAVAQAHSQTHPDRG
jgi:small conductance mechanosensitive channel